MVYTNIHNCPDDPHLDLPCISDAHHWTARGHLECEAGSCTFPAHHYRGHNDPRRWLLDVTDGILSLHLQAHDAEAPKRKHAARYVRFGGTERVYRCWSGEHGIRSEAIIPT